MNSPTNQTGTPANVPNVVAYLEHLQTIADAPQPVHMAAMAILERVIGVPGQQPGYELGRLSRAVFRVVRSPETVEDIIQGAWVHLAERPAIVIDAVRAGTIAGLIHTACRNFALMHVRASGQKGHFSLEQFDHPTEPREQEKLLADDVWKLVPKMHHKLVGLLASGATKKEAAQVLDISRPTLDRYLADIRKGIGIAKYRAWRSPRVVPQALWGLIVPLGRGRRVRQLTAVASLQ